MDFCRSRSRRRRKSRHMSNPLSLSGCRHDVLGHSLKAIGILQARESIGIVRLELDDEVYVARHGRPRIIAGALYHAALERETLGGDPSMGGPHPYPRAIAAEREGEKR